MTRKRVTTIVLVAGAVLLLRAFLASDHEPRYRGRTLSAWLAVHNANPRNAAEAAKAVHQIGTNALPFLVRWVVYTPPPGWRMALASAVRKVGGNSLAQDVESFDLRVDAALTGFQILGPEAAPAIPALTNRLNLEWNFYDGNHMIYRALNYMGTAGLAPLITIVTNKTVPPLHRATALLHIGSPPRDIGTNANWIVPLLCDLLKDREIGYVAAVTLGDLRLNAPVAVPALIACLQDNNAPCRAAAAQSLGRFGKEATSAVPVLTDALSSKDAYVRGAATNALKSIAPEVLNSSGH